MGRASGALEFDLFTAEVRALASNAVLIKGKDEAVLVDNCLIQSDAQKLVNMIRSSGRELTSVLITHAHPDHYFGLPAIREAFPRARMYARKEVIDGMREFRAKVVHWQEMYRGELPEALPLPEPLTGDSIVERPSELAYSVEGVQPGLHAFDGYDVVWWAPSVLRLGVEPRFGIRQQELLGKEADPALVEASLRRFAEWQNGRDAAVAAGSAPSLAVTTATARAAADTRDAAAVEVIELPRPAARPGGPRFGALVHAVLATAPLAATQDAIARAAIVQGRLLGAPPDEVDAAVTAVAGALAHPLLARARGAVCRRETPLTLRDGDGTLVEGTVDLAFLDGSTWIVVDFKTDQELSKNLDAYRRQVVLYADAITAATGQPARSVLLRV